MAGQQKKQKGQQKKKGCRAAGRNSGAYSQWAQGDVTARKLRRVIQSNGYDFALKWARDNGVESRMRALTEGTQWIQQKAQEPELSSMHLKVGRALRRRMRRLRMKQLEAQRKLQASQPQQPTPPPAQ